MATEPEDDPADAMAAGALQVTAGVGDTVNSAHRCPPLIGHGDRLARQGMVITAHQQPSVPCTSASPMLQTTRLGGERLRQRS